MDRFGGVKSAHDVSESKVFLKQAFLMPIKTNQKSTDFSAKKTGT